MAADSTMYVAAYLRAIEGFNNGDFATFGELLSDDCTFDGTAGHFGSSRDEMVKGLKDARNAGWLSHDPIGTAAAGEFLVVVFENKFADGSRVTAAGCVRFNDDSKVTEIRSMDPRSRRDGTNPQHARRDRLRRWQVRWMWEEL